MEGQLHLHFVKEIKDNQVLIGNNIGKTNGWVDGTAVVAKVSVAD